MDEKVEDRSGVIAPPPIINLGFLAVALGLNYFVPLRIHPMVRIPGALLVLSGIVLMALCVRTMKAAETNVSPYKPTTMIISSGPYGFSRNPIYLGFALIYLGVGLAVASLWPILLFPVLVLVMRFFVIAREERYLESKFGAEYVGYKSRVRRWV